MRSVLRAVAAARSRPLHVLLTAALLVFALFLIDVAGRTDGPFEAPEAGAGSRLAASDPSDVFGSAWSMALNAGAESLRHASAPRRALTG